jgi:hypothetical protein
VPALAEEVKPAILDVSGLHWFPFLGDPDCLGDPD